MSAGAFKALFLLMMGAGIPVAIAMSAGFGIFACGWIAPPLASVLGWICDKNLLRQAKEIEFFQRRSSWKTA